MRRQMNWLAERGLLHNSYTCPQCQVLCSLVVQWASQDGFRWRCRQCQQRASVRKGSFFKSNLPLGKLMWMLLSWASDTPVNHVAWHLDVSQHTLVDWSNFIRDVCAEDTRRNAVQLRVFDANGQPIVVEIDESYFFHRKYHRGRFHNRLWVFGAIKRESGRCMLQVVADRTAQTLLPIIQQWCLPGTHIISDGWPSYQNIPQLNGGVFLHDVVIHQVNFVDPNNPEIHTQNIENLWMRAKCKLRRQFGTTRPLLPTYTCTWKISCGSSETRITDDAWLVCWGVFASNTREDNTKKPKGSFQSQPFFHKRVVCYFGTVNFMVIY